MAKELRIQTSELRTRYRIDASGLLFVSCEDPKMSLTFNFDSDTLQDDMVEGLRGLFKLIGKPADDIQLIDASATELVWLVSAPAFERFLQVA